MSSNREEKNATNKRYKEMYEYEALFEESPGVLESVYKELGLYLLNTSTSPTASTSADAAKRRKLVTTSTEVQEEVERNDDDESFDRFFDSMSDRLDTVESVPSPSLYTENSVSALDGDDIITTSIQIVDLSEIEIPHISDYTSSDDDNDLIVLGDSDSKEESLDTVYLDDSLNSSNNDDSPVHKKFTCPICSERMENREPTTTKCGHIFCLSCITKVIQCKKACPICKSKLTESMLIRIYL